LNVSVLLNEQGFVLNGREVPWVSGDIHYWRHSAKDWPVLLERIKALGFGVVCTYIPWSVHEATPGTFDFGDLDPAKDVGRFIDLVAQHGLHLLVRPGPHINAELTYFGYPARLFDNPQFLARNARGGAVILPVLPRAFPVISYASEAFWRELESWFDALAPILKPRVYPHGPIIGLQLDNELSYFFRTSAYDQDYHPDARAKWLDFLKGKYGDLAQAADIYDTKEPLANKPLPDDFKPASRHAIPFYLDWMEFKEALLGQTLARLRQLWEDRGVTGVVYFHNYPVCEPKTPLNLPLAEKTVQACGVDFYLHKTDYASLRRKLLYLTGQSRFPVSPEFASGCYHLWPPVDLADQEFTTRVAWMFGLRGINYYMLVERERWYGSPITRTGGVRREPWNFFERQMRLVNQLRPWTLRRVAPVCLLSVREYERLEGAATAVAPLPPLWLEDRVPGEDLCLEDTFGFSRPIQYLHAKMLRGWEHALTRLGIPYVIGSTDLGPENLAAYQVVVCPTFEFLRRRTQETLIEYATGGGYLVCGPEVPSLDDGMWEFSALSHYTSRPKEKVNGPVDIVVCEARVGKIVLAAEVPLPVENALPVVEAICRYLNVEAVYPTAPPCETSLLEDTANGRRVLFVANPTPKPQRPRLQTVGASEYLVDLERGDRFFGDGIIEVDLPPYTVRALEIRP
jgi:beta-galactosidase